MYKHIEDEIINELINENLISDFEIVYENQIVDPNLNLFIRPSWIYGQCSDATDLRDKQNSIFSIQIFERKDSNSNDAESLGLRIRKSIKRLNSFQYESDFAKIISAGLTVVDNDTNFKQINVFFTIQIYSI